ncbi:hypothetical protein ASF72_11960 [Arthrobacter sp. Leaf141]|uniref:hypothetical protein n=1 Tax=Arthrobacter sp. Leaf141 TaxID=1736273 RepID=UPI0006FC66AA|nr:hypothetical protein [Arthrobacter sp. Leaf141]KQR02318.1 hypothetical protein ASF72_11960 [Arthrobacter sp. Leaf141]
MRKTSLIGAAICTAAFIGLQAAPAMAAGQVERGPAHANSICSFSGQNDTPDDPVEGGRVQSYGQIVKAGGKAMVPSPGLLCNGHKFPYPEAFEGMGP